MRRISVSISKGYAHEIICVHEKKDIDRFLIECNFTPDEERLFRLRCKEYTLEYCAEQMNVSISTVKRLSRRVNSKIIKVC